MLMNVFLFAFFSCISITLFNHALCMMKFDCLACAAALLMRYNRCPSYNQSVLAFNHFSLAFFILFASVSQCKRMSVKPFRVNQRLNCRCKRLHVFIGIIVEHLLYMEFHVWNILIFFSLSISRWPTEIFSNEAATAINLSVNLLLISRRSNVTSM